MTEDLHARLDIIELCTKFGWYYDQRDWDRLAGIFTEQVTTRTSADGERRQVPARDLIASWTAQTASLQSTQHQITDHLVELDGDRATCTAQFRVRHIAVSPVREGQLENAGHFRFDLARGADGWRIAAVLPTIVWTSGDPAVLAPAGRPGQDAQAVGRRFLERISAKDLEGAFDCLAEDVRMEMPFAPPGSPTLLEGAAALRRLYTGVVTSVRSIDLPVVDSQPFADPQWAMIEYTGKMIQPDGQDYTNHYHGLFRVVDGKIKVYRELYDTYRFAAQIPEEARHAMFRTSDEG